MSKVKTELIKVRSNQREWNGTLSFHQTVRALIENWGTLNLIADLI